MRVLLKTPFQEMLAVGWDGMDGLDGIVVTRTRTVKRGGFALLSTDRRDQGYVTEQPPGEDKTVSKLWPRTCCGYRVVERTFCCPTCRCRFYSVWLGKGV